MLTSLAETANPSANSWELPARLTAADTGWVWAARTGQGNTGHGDDQLPCPLPCGSNGKSSAQMPRLPASLCSASIQKLL